MIDVIGTEYEVFSVVIVFLLVIVLIMQIQMRKMSKDQEEVNEKISEKIDELIIKTNKKHETVLNSSHLGNKEAASHL